MTPTPRHLRLLGLLPDRAHLRLRQIGPGWQENKETDLWPHPWVLRGTYQALPASYWLPCDPCAILTLAADLNPHADPGRYQRATLSRLGAGWNAALEYAGEQGPEAIDQTGDDPHEAALAVLWAVCRGDSE